MPTGIPYLDETWNPVTGCTPISRACANCWAARRAKMLAGRFGYPPSPDEFSLTLHADRLDQPKRWTKPRRIGPCWMGDLFHEGTPVAWIQQVWQAMLDAPHHTYWILTKRPHVMRDRIGTLCLDVPDNFWLGTTVENQPAANDRIAYLLDIACKNKWLSVEPLLGQVTLRSFRSGYILCCDCLHGEAREYGTSKIGWVVVGCESGPGARVTQNDWVARVRDDCRSARVPVYVKQITMPDGTVSKEPKEWPVGFRVQEVPYPSGLV